MSTSQCPYNTGHGYIYAFVYTFTFNQFVYTDPQNATHSFNNSAKYVQDPGGQTCPTPGPTPATLVLNGSGYTINFYPLVSSCGSCTGNSTPYNQSTAQLSASGYVNPKYLIIGVTYAPPGPSSFVNYTNSTLVGTETSISSSFSSNVTTAIKLTASSIQGWASGKVSASSSTAYTQESSTSSSVSVSKQTTVSDQTPGPANPYVGINHDYDVIWLWLNPVALLTTSTDAYSELMQWNGYGYSTLDQPTMDVYPVYVGWLNGDIPMTPSQSAPLARAWAANQVWPSGQGPGLTNTDFQNIVQADPYWQCTKTPSVCPTSVDPTRFTLTFNTDFVYQQAPVGGQPQTQTYSDSYINTTTQNHGAKYTFAEMFSTEVSFSNSLVLFQLDTSLTQQSTLTWVHEWNRKITNTNTSTASLSITGPPCVVSGSTCNPLYAGSTQFDLYQDVLYGTFLLNPVN